MPDLIAASSHNEYENKADYSEVLQGTDNSGNLVIDFEPIANNDQSPLVTKRRIFRN